MIYLIPFFLTQTDTKQYSITYNMQETSCGEKSI